MHKQNNAEQMREIQRDQFLEALLQTASGGHPADNLTFAQYEAEQKDLEDQINLESARERNGQR